METKINVTGDWMPINFEAISAIFGNELKINSAMENKIQKNV